MQGIHRKERENRKRKQKEKNTLDSYRPSHGRTCHNSQKREVTGPLVRLFIQVVGPRYDESKGYQDKNDREGIHPGFAKRRAHVKESYPRLCDQADEEDLTGLLPAEGDATNPSRHRNERRPEEKRPRPGKPKPSFQRTQIKANRNDEANRGGDYDEYPSGLAIWCKKRQNNRENDQGTEQEWKQMPGTLAGESGKLDQTACEQRCEHSSDLPAQFFQEQKPL
jgi:hypothetical protein